MAYEQGGLDAAIAAVAGVDSELACELRAVYRASLVHHADLLHRARCDANWQVAAQRLRGLAASFDDGALLALAEDALAGAPGDPAVQRRLARYAQGL